MTSQGEVGFYNCSEEQQIDILIERVKEGDRCYDLLNAAKEQKRLEHLLSLFVQLLSIKDERVMLATHDVVTEYSADGRVKSEPVNERVDDTLFMEYLLYILRDNLPKNSIHIGAMVHAYENEGDPWTRMRIVRAIGRIGGEYAVNFCRLVLKNEGEYRTMAAQEASKYIK
ncbi:hypothetical protein ACFL35_21640 [Candidatus Riflebacteria bacterium]